MSYIKTEWQNGTTVLSADNLNKIENGILSNSNDIDKVKDSLKFMGEISALPQESTTGYMYQAASSNILRNNKIGDLLVCISEDPLEWHIIPSGDETSGTVTTIYAADGLKTGSISSNNSNSPITDAGSISLDPSYTANGSRSGLLSSTLFNQITNLLNTTSTVDFEKVEQIPEWLSSTIGLSQEVPSETEHPDQVVVSEAGIRAALDTKSNSNHRHFISEINELTSKLTPSNEYQEDPSDPQMVTKVASESHRHGFIDKDGYMYDNTGNRISTVKYLRTESSTGKIVTGDNIPSSAIKGTTFEQGIDIKDTQQDVDTIKEILESEDNEHLIEHAAERDHTHSLFSEERNGFVPQLPSDVAVGKRYILYSDGWTNITENYLNMFYPVGSYYETSLIPKAPSGATKVSDLTNEDKETLGVTWFNPNFAWGGIWKLETEGIVHVSGSYLPNITQSSNISNDNPVGDNTSSSTEIISGNAGSAPAVEGVIIKYPVTSSHTDYESELGRVGKIDGGVESVKLTAGQSGIRKHSHPGRKTKFYVRSGKGYPTILKSSDNITVISEDTAYGNGDKLLKGFTYTDYKHSPRSITIDISPANNVPNNFEGENRSAISAHENRQPYINVYRWHRLPGDNSPIVPIVEDEE